MSSSSIPSGPADELLPELERRGLRCGAILVTHGHFDHILGVADLAEASGADVTMPEGERFLLESPEGFTPPGITVRPWSPEIGVVGGETLERCGLRFEVLSGSRALASARRVCGRRRAPLG